MLTLSIEEHRALDKAFADYLTNNAVVTKVQNLKNLAKHGALTREAVASLHNELMAAAKSLDVDFFYDLNDEYPDTNLFGFFVGTLVDIIGCFDKGAEAFILPELNIMLTDGVQELNEVRG